MEQSLENVDAVGERDAEQGDFAKALVATNIAAKAKGRRRRSSPRKSRIRDGKNVLYVDKCLLGHLLALCGRAVRVIAMMPPF